MSGRIELYIGAGDRRIRNLLYFTITALFGCLEHSRHCRTLSTVTYKHWTQKPPRSRSTAQDAACTAGSNEVGAMLEQHHACHYVELGLPFCDAV